MKHCGNRDEESDVEFESEETRAMGGTFGGYNLKSKLVGPNFLDFGIEHWCTYELDWGWCYLWI